MAENKKRHEKDWVGEEATFSGYCSVCLTWERRKMNGMELLRCSEIPTEGEYWVANREMASIPPVMLRAQH